MRWTVAVVPRKLLRSLPLENHSPHIPIINIHSPVISCYIPITHWLYHVISPSLTGYIPISPFIHWLYPHIPIHSLVVSPSLTFINWLYISIHWLYPSNHLHGSQRGVRCHNATGNSPMAAIMKDAEPWAKRMRMPFVNQGDSSWATNGYNQ